MYVPASFREDRVEVLHDVMRANSFGTIISTGADGLVATHLPFLVSPEPAPHGRLAAHLARANPHWRDWTDGQEVLVIFQGPHAYISPNWYVSKEAVPTWNYVAVHVYGTPRLIEDPEEVLSLLRDLTRANEGDGPAAWQVPWPDGYVEKLMRGIVGFTLTITRLEGKFKLSQNRAPEDARSALTELARHDDSTEQAAARLMADALAGRPSR